jgi:hypothetical protein
MVVRALSDQNPGQGGPASIPDYIAWKERNRTLESIGASIANQQDLTGDESGVNPERLFGVAVTPSLFDVLKVKPRTVLPRGRGPGPKCRHASSEPSSVAAAPERKFWAEIRLDGRNLRIIGVMPRAFWYPSENSEYWIPFAPTRFQIEGSGRLFMVAGRLKAGITVDQAQADVAAIAAQLARDFPDRNGGWSARVTPLRDYWFGWIRGPLLTFEAGVILVLLIACANVSTLLLARIPARRAEITMRLLLGAGRGRIVRQFLTESLLLSVIGGSLGVLIAWW